MLSTEKVFDMLPMIVEVYDKLDVDSFRKKIAEENKNKENISNEIIGIDFFKFLAANSGKVKEEIFEIVGIFEEKPVEEIKAQSFIKTINTMKEIFSDKDATELFKSAIK